jgi:hypothetical protein
MDKKFESGEIIKICGALNCPNEYGVVISEEDFIQQTNYMGEKFESGSVFYKTGDKIEACNATFLRVTNHIRKSSLGEAVSDLEKQVPHLEQKLKSLNLSLDFFKYLH